MSYNNIGLTTPRGSGTSGYVQRNLSQPRPSDDYRGKKPNERYADDGGPGGGLRKPDQSILDHERKRRVENKCVELQLELEEEGLDEQVVEERVAQLRQKLLKEDSLLRSSGPLKPHESHEIAAMKQKENDKFRSALRVRGTYVEGQAFDRELQAQRKAQAIEERQMREAEHAARGIQSRGSRGREKPYDKPL
ncbi:hypothetical protein PTTG_04902 [Puccinia triticina 1-1 BBBD Race 1]|uniref:Cwf21 domain-containing protein n=2 Tax=Puccinia triticina TaxID=208348 RepID=A0A0C4EVR6_PUCT1|nr:uncharacterized protein PtA15_11A454 [Puccinia triticina]OAV95856.1 hypothetical protein PTTG_04902 [Puccinia triticina 1-1 BBBD Race 1]WAQ89763.1 hypothetical protein PtA15_11A454 [Puccinia triticina]